MNTTFISMNGGASGPLAKAARVLALFAAAALLLTTAGCSGDDDTIDIVELEKSLVGVWWDEFEYSDVTETGVPFTRALLAVKADADHTGCIYLGLFDDTDDLPLAVYGGPQDAPFTWQLRPDGSLHLSIPALAEGRAAAVTRSADDYGGQMTDVSSTSMTCTTDQMTLTNGSYTGTLAKADASEEAEILNRLSMPPSAVSTNLSDEGAIGISDSPQGTWGR